MLTVSGRTSRAVTLKYCHDLSNSYIMSCPPVRADNPRALASGLSYVQVEKHGITIYTIYISVEYAQHELVRIYIGDHSCKSVPQVVRLALI